MGRVLGTHKVLRNPDYPVGRLAGLPIAIFGSGRPSGALKPVTIFKDIPSHDLSFSFSLFPSLSSLLPRLLSLSHLLFYYFIISLFFLKKKSPHMTSLSPFSSLPPSLFSSSPLSHSRSLSRLPFSFS